MIVVSYSARHSASTFKLGNNWLCPIVTWRFGANIKTSRIPSNVDPLHAHENKHVSGSDYSARWETLEVASDDVSQKKPVYGAG